MNDGDPRTTAIFIFIAIVIIFAIGLSVGGWTRDLLWEASAIKAGVGEYNQKTSKFQWANHQNE